MTRIEPIFRPKPWWLRMVSARYVWFTIHPYVYHPVDTDPTEPSYVPIVEHEKEHLRQQGNGGKWTWLLKYCLSRKFRLNREVEALAAELPHRPQEHHDWRIEGFARQLSSMMYFWCATYKAAEAAIRSEWAKHLSQFSR